MPVKIDLHVLLHYVTHVVTYYLSVTGVSNAVGGLAVLDAGSITFTPKDDNRA